MIDAYEANVKLAADRLAITYELHRAARDRRASRVFRFGPGAGRIDEERMAELEAFAAPCSDLVGRFEAVCLAMGENGASPAQVDMYHDSVLALPCAGIRTWWTAQDGKPNLGERHKLMRAAAAKLGELVESGDGTVCVILREDASATVRL